MKKTILITGTSSGFGFLAASTLAQRGHHVIATMRDPAGNNRQARDALSKIHGLEVVELDVCSDESVVRAVSAIEQRGLPIDVLVNNAGAMFVGVTEAYTSAEVLQQFDVNVFGPLRVARAVLPGMRARRSGLLLHVSSVAGRVIFPFFGLYCASKYALEALAESLRYELASFNVDSVLVEPGPFSTNLLPTSPAPHDAERLTSYGELASMPEQLKNGFRQVFASAHPPRNEDVVAALQKLIEQEGRRPLRTVVMPDGMDFGVDRLNTQTAEIQTALMKAFQLETML